MADQNISGWELGLALDAIGINDPAQQQQVANALPVASKLIDHINDNMPLFKTLFADIEILIPAAKLVTDALKEKKS